MIRKTSITQTFFFVFCAALFSSNAYSLGSADTEEINRSAKLPNSPCSFSGNFTQSRTLKGLDKNLESNGVFYYHCESGVIWSTTSPTDETLIFARNGRNFQIKDQKITQIKTRQSKLLGNLLNSMMSGDQTEIEQQFLLEKMVDTNSQFKLLPKKKSIKRAIKQILLTFTESEHIQTNAKLNQISIQILDRKNQLTSIDSIQTNTFEPIDINEEHTELLHNQCLSSSITSQACDQLYLKAQ